MTSKGIRRAVGVSLLCAAAAFAQGGGRGRGRGAAGASGEARNAAAPPAAAAAGGRGGGRFKIYPQDSVDRGLTAYNTTCGYCHGEKAKGGQAGPDLITSDVSLHDEDGVQLGTYLKGAVHQKAVKLDVPVASLGDIASYIHSRIVVAAGRGDIHLEDVLAAGDPKAGQAYFNGAGGCNKCHSPDGNLKGVASKYDVSVLQDRIVMPRAGRGGGGRGGPAAPESKSTAITATVTPPNGQTVKGDPILVSDFNVTLRLADGSTQTWGRNNGVPKVELTDPLQAHIDTMMKLKDQDLHNLTAYLATLK